MPGHGFLGNLVVYPPQFYAVLCRTTLAFSPALSADEVPDMGHPVGLEDRRGGDDLVHLAPQARVLADTVF